MTVATKSAGVTIHVLVPNNAKRAPYADRTACGIDLNENQNTPSVWPDEFGDREHLAPDKWAPKGYRWCRRCSDKRQTGQPSD